MRSALLLGMVTLVLGGCSATLRGDAFYRCDDGSCPSGFQCHSDHFCYRGGEDGGMDAGALPDTFVPGVDTGMTGTCSGGTLGSCAGGQTCVVGGWGGPGTMPTYQCVSGPLDVAVMNHGAPCTMGDTTCHAPDVCMMQNGSSRCMRPCFPSSTCGFQEDCVTPAGSTMGMTCAPACGTPPTCPRFGFTCSVSTGHCLPPGW